MKSETKKQIKSAILPLTVVAVILFGMGSCVKLMHEEGVAERVKYKEFQTKFEQPRALYKVASNRDRVETSSANGGLFFIFGSYHKTSKSEMEYTVTFAYEDQDEYGKHFTMLTVPLSKVKVSLVENNSPTVRLVLFDRSMDAMKAYTSYHGYHNSAQNYVNTYVAYVTLNVPSALWKPKFDLPLN